MIKNYIEKINKCKGKIIIIDNYENSKFILALLFYMKHYMKINKNEFYVFNKYAKGGLFRLAINTNVIKDEDLVISINNEDILNKKLIIDKDIIRKNIDLQCIEKEIDKHYKSAYSQITYFSKEYMNEISILPNMFYKEGLLKNYDYNSKYVNIINGLRYSSGSGKCIFKSPKIHFFGDSRIYGAYVEDNYTIPSLVSKKTGLKCLNYGTYGTSIFDIQQQFKMANITKGDIVVINNGFIKAKEKKRKDIINQAVILEIEKIKRICDEKGAHFILCILPNCSDKKDITRNELNYCIYHELQKLQESNSKYYSLNADWNIVMDKLIIKGISFCNIICEVEKDLDMELFIDYIHFGSVGNNFIADRIVKYIKNILHEREVNLKIEKEIKKIKGEYEEIICERRGDSKSQFFDKKKFDEFLNNLKELSKNKTSESGVIVMNANPFTNGHHYILKEALKYVSHIYVLVVQEGETVIPFNDRIDLIKRGTHDIKNIDIIPSSEFVVSNITLPEYFNKDKKKFIKVDASRDIDLFVNYIMPALNVKVRIAGTEPICKVTREYNRQIEERFMYEGLKFILIDRKKYGVNYISASYVRNAIINGNLKIIKDYVPITTYSYLVKNKQKIYERILRTEVK